MPYADFRAKLVGCVKPILCNITANVLYDAGKVLVAIVIKWLIG